MEKELPPLKMNYNFDSGLMYLIQETTKKESLDILAFFSDLAKAIAEQGQTKNKGKGIRKVLLDFFPGTAIPFEMKVEGWVDRNRHWDQTLHTYLDRGEQFSCNVSVYFPQTSIRMSESLTQKVTEALIERELLGDNTTLEPFDRPTTKTPKMYQDMMVAICGKAPARPKVAGYDPDIVGVCRNCGRKGPKAEGYYPSYACECDKAK